MRTNRYTPDLDASPAGKIIKRLGGLTRTAGALNLGVSTVQGWALRGRIPQEHWKPLIDVAKAQGWKLRLEEFLEVAA